MTVLLEPDGLTRDGLMEAINAPVEPVGTFEGLDGLIIRDPDLATVILGPTVEFTQAVEFATRMRGTSPTVGVLLVRRRVDAAIMTRAIRSGVREVVAERDLPALSDAVQRSLALTSALRNPHDTGASGGRGAGALTTVVSPKGGAGKTTLAVNIGVALAMSGQRTLLLDLDLDFGDVPISLGLRPEHTFADAVAMGEGLDASALNGLVTVHESGLHVLAPTGEPGETVQAAPGSIRRLVHVGTSEYEYVIVDTPSALDERLLEIMEASDVVFVLTTLDIASLKNVKLFLEALRLVGFPTERLRIVLNRADTKVGLDPREVARALGFEVLGRIPSSRDVPATANRGVAIIADQPRHAVSVAITNLVHQEISREVPTTRRGNGRFSRRRTG